MGTRPRLPTNVIDSLEDATALVLAMWPELKRAGQQAERYEDVRLLGALNRAAYDLAGVEHHLRAARAGRYEPWGRNRETDGR